MTKDILLIELNDIHALQQQAIKLKQYNYQKEDIDLDKIIEFCEERYSIIYQIYKSIY